MQDGQIFRPNCFMLILKILRRILLRHALLQILAAGQELHCAASYELKIASNAVYDAMALDVADPQVSARQVK